MGTRRVSVGKMAEMDSADSHFGTSSRNKHTSMCFLEKSCFNVLQCAFKDRVLPTCMLRSGAKTLNILNVSHNVDARKCAFSRKTSGNTLRTCTF